jgi:hypothetical protein
MDGDHNNPKWYGTDGLTDTVNNLYSKEYCKE